MIDFLFEVAKEIIYPPIFCLREREIPLSAMEGCGDYLDELEGKNHELD